MWVLVLAVSVSWLVCPAYCGMMVEMTEMLFGVVGQVGPRTIFFWWGGAPLMGKANFGRNLTAQCKHIGRMLYITLCCGVDVAYRQLSDWTHLQWALYSYHKQRASPFSAIRGGSVALHKLF